MESIIDSDIIFPSENNFSSVTCTFSSSWCIKSHEFIMFIESVGL